MTKKLKIGNKYFYCGIHTETLAQNGLILLSD